MLHTQVRFVIPTSTPWSFVQLLLFSVALLPHAEPEKELFECKGFAIIRSFYNTIICPITKY